jgi:hypothetical protein
VSIVKRITLVLAAVVSVIVYVWVAAVRAVPAVRRRKAAARSDRRRR